MSEQGTRRSRAKKFIALSAVVVFATVLTVFMVNMVQTLSEVRGRHTMEAYAQTEPGGEVAKPEAAKGNMSSMSMGFLAAALSTGIGCIGAGIAVSSVGAAGLGVIGEKPELTARALIFVGLAEGIAIYGLIIAIMILTRI
jgi:V/A-type H+-transporting ATPase subunit K